jgi:hypothetical protein
MAVHMLQNADEAMAGKCTMVSRGVGNLALIAGSIIPNTEIEHEVPGMTPPDMQASVSHEVTAKAPEAEPAKAAPAKPSAPKM